MLRQLDIVIENKKIPKTLLICLSNTKRSKETKVKKATKARATGVVMVALNEKALTKGRENRKKTNGKRNNLFIDYD